MENAVQPKPPCMTIVVNFNMASNSRDKLFLHMYAYLVFHESQNPHLVYMDVDSHTSHEKNLHRV